MGCLSLKPSTISYGLLLVILVTDVSQVSSAVDNLKSNFLTCSRTEVRKRNGKRKEDGDGVGSRGGRM